MPTLPLSDAVVVDEESPSRFVVGIDLGTTNSAVCYVDTVERPWRVRVLEIPQLVAPGQVEARDTLPSFHYQPPAPTPPSPAPPHVVGFMARDWASGTPGRVVASAKSWLCHPGVDRTADLLPWHAAADVERISPIEASSRYLAHIAQAWNRKFPAEPLDRQDIVLTLPASFDEIAREFTVQAAARAGLARVVLIEEPQAAFYAWIYKHEKNWDQLVSPGQKILVCDIGGGTTDFTLIRVRAAEGRGGGGTLARSASEESFSTQSPVPSPQPPSRIQFHRVAVGDHLILGGDNMDLALAQYLERKLMQSRPLTPSGPDSATHSSQPADLNDEISVNSQLSPSRREGTTFKLQPRQWDALLRLARQAKEQLLAEGVPEQLTITIPGSGSKLIGGSLQTSLSRDEARQMLVEGFMPRVALTDKPAPRRSGFQEFGLPYAADPAMTRYLAAFLTAHRWAGEDGGRRQESGKRSQESGVGSWETEVDPARPDAILFNGGVFESPILRQRLIDSIIDWFPTLRTPHSALRNSPAPLVLDNDRLDLAVARGAAYYGMVRRGDGVKIVASLARTYYIGVDSNSPTPGPQPSVPSSALCLVPGNAEPGQDIEMPDRTFDLLVSEPVEFPLYTSSIRLTDRPGELVPVDPEQMTALPPIRTALKTKSRRERGTVPVHLHAKLTEIGTLDLWCSEVRGDRTWRLQFDVRSATETNVEAHAGGGEAAGFVDEAATADCREVLAAVFDPASNEKPDSLMKHLAEAAGSERHQWPPSLLRRMWEMLMELEPGRRKSPPHEARWLNLLGYALRPGYGLAVDDWRVAETWKTVQGKLAHSADTSRTESLILWRRIAGGLSAGQQRALAEPLLATVRGLHKRHTTTGGKGTDPVFSPHEAQEVLRLLGSLELLAVEVKIELGWLLVELLGKKKLEPLRSALAWTIGRLGARQPAYGPLNTIVPPTEAGAWVERILAVEMPDSMLLFPLVNLARKTGDRYRDLPEPVPERVLDWLTKRKLGEHAIMLVRDGGALDQGEQDRVFGESLPIGLRIR